VSSEQVWVLAGGALALALLVLALLQRRAAARAGRELAAARAEAQALADRLALVEESLARDVDRRLDPQSYVITHLGDEEPETTPVVGRIDGKLFADIVARESVIKAAGLVHGLRRAMAPESRNRIRFEMSREVKRARKQRRVELKAALREFRARERTDLAGHEDGRPGERPGERQDEGDAA
jgi:hypothetical protein